jgi:hypothetical protein
MRLMSLQRLWLTLLLLLQVLQAAQPLQFQRQTVLQKQADPGSLT